LPEGLLALALWCRHRIPFVCYCHGEDVNFFGTSRELSWLIRRIIGSTAFIIANSRNTQRILSEDWQVPAERVRMLHPGVDVRQFHPAPPDAASRAKLGWDGRPVILTVGRLQKRKGHDQLILALHQIRKSIPDILYAIMGDGEERSALGELVRREDLGAHVMFMGERHDADLVTCYQQCDLFALPNRQIDKDIEGFGMVLLEAQACGKPVVAGQSGGTAETMRIPDTGLVVPCNGPDQLAELVVELFSNRDRMARMGAAGRQWVVENFDWAVLSQKANRLFTESKAANRSHKNANGSCELVRLSVGERVHRPL
jgi:phosphatidyl-myo-inositol dimannoside synthase